MWVWVVEADLHHFSSLPRLLWMWPVLMSTKLLHDVCAQDTFLFVFFPMQMHACGQGKHCAHTNKSSLTMQQMPDTCFFSQSTQLPESWKTKQSTRQTDLWQEHLHSTYNTHVQTDIPNPRGIQIHPSPCPMPCPMHFLSTRLHLPVWMLLRLTSGQQQPCPFPCIAPVRHLSPDHSTAAGISWRWVWNVNSLWYLTHPREINGSSGQRGKLQAASLKKQHLGKSIGDALYLPGLNLTSCTIIFKNLAAGKAKPFPSEE